MAQHGFWMRRVVDGFTGAAEALFPENGRGFPDWRATETPARFVTYLAVLPPPQRRLLMLLFAFLELAPPLLFWGLGRFSRLPVARRTRAVDGLRESRIWVLKLLGDAIKATVTMIYFAHPAPLARAGFFKVCENTQDPLQVTVRRDYFRPGGEA